MQFLSIPSEIRLQIFSQLLVQESPIDFDASHGPCNPRLFRQTQALPPALLRVSKKMHQEAIELIYSNNCFRFPNAYTSSDLDSNCLSLDTAVPYVAPFLKQIGPNADLLRHICIEFPTSHTFWHKPILPKEYIEVLQLIKDSCTNLRTIEIACKPPLELPISDVDYSARVLKALDDGGLKQMHSLENIVVIHGDYDIDEETVASCEALRKKLPSMKWSIELTKVPPRTWISDDDRVKYNDELQRREEERYEQQEEEEWLEEYYRRRNDPYWKNLDDSDYD
ncbi:unnamed protein product [Clonostachys rosea]|uniref:F-box domain-containing protein n=1 Tax=Bionectria ochroleuca TaxID=29856 RepID=A0ABY6UP56_BIOOC|nr:unnamed protein product [Clonostachys rosea]